MTTREYRIMLVSSAAASLAGGALSALLFLGSAVSAEEASGRGGNTVRAEAFHLVDAQGKTRAVLALSAEGEPALTMLDRNDIGVIWLGISENSGLTIHDIDGKTRLVMGLDPDGQPSLVIRDRQHRMRSFYPE
jgi:hypothetical protein